MKKSTIKLTMLAGVTLLLATACTQERPAAASAKLAEQAKAKRSPSKKPPASGKVARIVFVDLEKCCACTRKRIDKSYKALTDVVGFPPVPDVERIHMDTKQAKAAPYKKLKPIMVPPAIYFLDKQGKLATFLQGEITQQQVREALK